MSRILIFMILCVISLQSCIKQETISYQAQFKSDTTSLGSFVRNNNPDAIKVSSGIWYSIDSLANGIYPTTFDSVSISYEVKWIEHSSTKESDLPTVGNSSLSIVLLSSAIAGLQQGLILFPANSSGRIYIPSGLAFGASYHSDTTKAVRDVQISPNSNLLYEIKLNRVRSSRFAGDTTTIGSFLRTNSLGALIDDSGIRYAVDTLTQTSTKKPQSGDSLLITYSENLLTTLDTAKAIAKEFLWEHQVTAWRIMLPKYLTEGSTITMYVPSGYAHGSSTISTTGATIPLNANMIYKITLVEINPH